MAKYMIYANFDEKVIGYCENVLDYEVGEFTKKSGREVMCYACLDLNYYGLISLRAFFANFKRIVPKFEKFHDKLNYVVESVLSITSTDAYGKLIEEKEEAAFYELANKIDRLFNLGVINK